MITIGNDNPAMTLLFSESCTRKMGRRLAPNNFLAIFFDVKIADVKQGQA